MILHALFWIRKSKIFMNSKPGEPHRGSVFNRWANESRIDGHKIISWQVEVLRSFNIYSLSLHTLYIVTYTFLTQCALVEQPHTTQSLSPHTLYRVTYTFLTQSALLELHSPPSKFISSHVIQSNVHFPDSECSSRITLTSLKVDLLTRYTE